MTRSSRLLAVGIVVIVVGLIVAFFALRDDGDITVNPPFDGATDGTGDPDATPTESPTDGIGVLAEDEERLPLPLQVPDGYEAVAITVPYANGVAAIPAPGDIVNVYAVFTDGVPTALLESLGEATPGADSTVVAANSAVIRLLSGVQVLGVTGTDAASGGGNVNFLVAVLPADAERLIYQAATQQLWLTLVNEDHEPVDGSGIVLENVLDEPSS